MGSKIFTDNTSVKIQLEWVDDIVRWMKIGNWEVGKLETAFCCLSFHFFFGAGGKILVKQMQDFPDLCIDLHSRFRGFNGVLNA